MAQDDTQAELPFEYMYVCSLAWLCLAKGHCAVVCRRQSSDAGRQSHRVGMGLIPKHLNQRPDRRVQRIHSDQDQSLIHPREPGASESSRNARVRGDIESNLSTTNPHLFFLFFARSAKSSSR